MIGFRLDGHDRSLLAEKADSYGLTPGPYARRVLREHLTRADEEATRLALARLEALVGAVRDELRRDLYDLRRTLLAFLGHVEVVDEGAEAGAP